LSVHFLELLAQRTQPARDQQSLSEVQLAPAWPGWQVPGGGLSVHFLEPLAHRVQPARDQQSLSEAQLGPALPASQLPPTAAPDGEDLLVVAAVDGGDLVVVAATDDEEPWAPEPHVLGKSSTFASFQTPSAPAHADSMIWSLYWSTLYTGKLLFIFLITSKKHFSCSGSEVCFLQVPLVSSLTLFMTSSGFWERLQTCSKKSAWSFVPAHIPCFSHS